MNLKEEPYDVGVVVGRFQVPELHRAHRELIEAVVQRHDKVIIFLGLSPLRVTRENPLDFEARKQMILDEFPKAIVLYCKDQKLDEVWSRKLDEQIGDVITPNQTVVIYGGRDSFIEHYSGRFPTRELEQDYWVSGKETRQAVSKRSVKASPEFRAGVVWAAYSGFPTCYPTVDVAIWDGRDQRILLGRKENEPLFRLIGGFADPRSESYEHDARREVMEEAGVEIGNPVYVGSAIIDDWRYRKETDCIKTLLFLAPYVYGRPTPGDDIHELKWFELGDPNLDAAYVVQEHRPLMAMLRDYLTTNGEA